MVHALAKAPVLSGLVVLAGACFLLPAASRSTAPGGELPGDTQVPTAGGRPDACVPAPLRGEPTGSYVGVPAPAWTGLFDRTSGWTGADGVYTVPLSGDERPCSAHVGTTFFTFSDTFIGQVDAQDHRLPGSTIVNNTMALLTGDVPSDPAITFHWRTDAQGNPGAQVVPDEPAGDFFWPGDGIVVDGTLYLYSLRLMHGGPIGATIDGVSLLSWVVDAGAPFATYAQVETPLFSGVRTFGRALLPDTTEAGAPAADGYVYLYGLQEDPLDKQLLVGRFRPESILDFASYEYWDGSAWVPDMAAAAPIDHRLSSEFSVSPLADGRYLLVYQQDDFLGPDVTTATAPTPQGPWSAPTPVYAIPEPVLDPKTIAYGSKAHPHLSRPDRLLVSYHVNTFDFGYDLENADVYHPRFIEIPLR